MRKSQLKRPPLLDASVPLHILTVRSRADAARALAFPGWMLPDG